MKKSLIVKMFLVFLLLLAGCGIEPDNNYRRDRSLPITVEKTSLNLMFYYEGQDRFAFINKLCNGFNKAQEEIEVVPVFIPFKDFKKAILTGIEEENNPDIIIIDNPDNVYFANIGILADITDNIADWPDKDQYFENSLLTCTYKGRIYGMPLGNNCLALFYNKKLFEIEGVKPPKTWDELRSVAKKMTKGDVKGIAIAAQNSEEGTYQFLPWLFSAGGSIEKLDSTEAVKAFSFLADLIKDGSMSREVINRTQHDVMKEFVAGKTAMMINGSWQIPQINSLMPDIEYGVVKIPKDKKFSSVLGGENIAIINSENKEKAIKFMFYVCKPENLKLYSSTLGYFPPRKDVALDPSIAQDFAIKVFENEMQYASLRGPNPKWPEISSVISGALQEVLTGTKEPESVVKDAQNKINLILEQ